MDTIEKRASWGSTDGSTVVASEKDELLNRLNINPATKLLH